MEEVNPDEGKAERSTTSGHLVITLPKTSDIIRPYKNRSDRNSSKGDQKIENPVLEVSPMSDEMDFSKITSKDPYDLPPLEAAD